MIWTHRKNWLEVSKAEYRYVFGTDLSLGREFNADYSSTQGPLVGEKRTSYAITEEYAKADPVYVAKTIVSTSASFIEPVLTTC